MDTNFERLRVYALAAEISDRIWTVVQGWEHFAKTTVGSQLVRAADSVGANLAEGLGRGSIQDTRRFVRIARGSLYEVKHWLNRAQNRELDLGEAGGDLSAMVNDLIPRLNAYIATLNRRC